MLLENTFVLILLVTVITCVMLIIVSGAFHLWLWASFAEAAIPMHKIISMKTRGTAKHVVRAFILCRKAGMSVLIEELEALYLTAPKQFDTQIQKLVHDWVKKKDTS